MLKFDKNNKRLRTQFDNVEWIAGSGLEIDELKELELKIEEDLKETSKDIVRAKIFEMALDKAKIAIDKDDIFQDKICARGIAALCRNRWHDDVIERYMAKERQEVRDALWECGAYSANADYGHTSPNSQRLMELGFTGLADRIKKASERENLTQNQKNFYESCKICMEAMIKFTKRLADAVMPYNEENAKALLNLTQRAPQNTYEAMQILIIYFFLHEYVFGTRVRTLGRLDVLMYPFYKNDIEKRTYTREELKDMLKFFLNKFWTAQVPFDLPLCIAGIDEEGEEVTNEFTYLFVETYNELDIYSPKIHVRVSDKTPKDFLKKVLSCIRGGNSSFVFVNDNTAIKSLINVGIAEKDANNYLPIGCYEPAVWGAEIGCTGNGGVNVAKAIELVVNNGYDLATGKKIGIETGKIGSYEDFVREVKAQIEYMAAKGMGFIKNIEKHYRETNPDPILSAMYDDSVERGLDVYEGGAKYNNTSYYIYCIASLIDSMAAVKKLVFDEEVVTFDKLCEILKNNWKGHEDLRLKALSLKEKYGNNEPLTDSITKEMSDFCTSLINNKPNSRGGVFKASVFCIDRFVQLGSKTMATPDGRYAGDILSKNICATVGMDKKGITALINSATKIDHTKCPNGTVLDFVVHPSAVSGDDGLEAFYGVLMTYIKKGGLAMHGNVFNPETLKEAQKNPEKYKNLQVRVCGWNVYFVNLSKVEQDAFIKQAENVACGG